MTYPAHLSQRQREQLDRSRERISLILEEEELARQLRRERPPMPTTPQNDLRRENLPTARLGSSIDQLHEQAVAALDAAEEAEKRERALAAAEDSQRSRRFGSVRQ